MDAKARLPKGKRWWMSKHEHRLDEGLSLRAHANLCKREEPRPERAETTEGWILLFDLSRSGPGVSRRVR